MIATFAVIGATAARLSWLGSTTATMRRVPIASASDLVAGHRVRLVGTTHAKGSQLATPNGHERLAYVDSVGGSTTSAMTSFTLETGGTTITVVEAPIDMLVVDSTEVLPLSQTSLATLAIREAHGRRSGKR